MTVFVSPAFLSNIFNESSIAFLSPSALLGDCIGGSLKVNIPHAAGTTIPFPPISCRASSIFCISSIPFNLLSSIKSPIQPLYPPHALTTGSPVSFMASFTSSRLLSNNAPSIS